MDANCTEKLILQANPALYDKSATGYKVKDALKKGDIGRLVLRLVSIVSILSIDLLCRFSFLVSRWRCDRASSLRLGWLFSLDLGLNLGLALDLV